MVNIFNDAQPKERGEFFKFAKAGDRVQGTYMEVREGTDSFGNAQFIYVLVDKENGSKTWCVGINKKTNPAVTEQMKNVHVGQIIGFQFNGRKESKRNPGKFFNEIVVFEDPTIVDEEEVERQKKIAANRVGVPVPTQSADGQPMSVGVADADEVLDEAALSGLRKLALEKGLTKKTWDAEKCDVAIIDYTGLALTTSNVSEIITKLTAYTA